MRTCFPCLIGQGAPKWQVISIIISVIFDLRKFSSPGGFNSGKQFYQYLKDAFDVLYAEGETAPKMLSIGMHCRILGRPGRFKALQRFLDYIQNHDKVWICRRGDIAEHWYNHHAP